MKESLLYSPILVVCFAGPDTPCPKDGFGNSKTSSEKNVSKQCEKGTTRVSASPSPPFSPPFSFSLSVSKSLSVFCFFLF